MKKRVLASFAMISVMTMPLSAATHLVPNQYSNIQTAINASNSGDTVIVADGTYTGSGNVNIDFGGRAITIRSENGPESTIIDCQHDARGFYFRLGEGASSRLVGLTIIYGYADYGGGIKCKGSSPTIENCTIQDCNAFMGGGIANDGSSPILISCMFSGNSSRSDGGGMNNNSSNPTLTNCVFIGNSSTEWSGGAIHNNDSSPILTNCVFRGNRAFRDGGAVCNGANSSPVLTSCVFIENEAGIEDGTFHDLRSTCITEWLEQGLMPHEVKELAGHADINTTMNYYVGIRESLIDRARGASSAALGEDLSAHFVHATQSVPNDKKQAASTTSQALNVSGVTETCGDRA